MEKLFNWIAYNPPTKGLSFFLWLLFSPLYLFSILYGTLVRTRLFLYSKQIFSAKNAGVKVISVGNLTMGGTGKTPTVEFIARNLTAKGIKVALVSRGYKRKSKDLLIVSDGEKIFCGPEEAGDEPYMLAKKLKKVPVIVGSERYEACVTARDNFSVDAVIMDDGFQHIKVERDVNILLVDGEKGFGNGFLFPRGPLREPLSSIERADMVMITKSNTVHSGLEERLRKYSKPIFRSSYRPDKLVSLKGEEKELDELKGKKAAILSAIASPFSFENTVLTLDVNIVYNKAFGDHHNYCKEEILKFCDKAKSLGAEYIITTEKDAVKIAQLELADEISIFSLNIEVDMSGDDEKFINELITTSGLKVNEN